MMMLLLAMALPQEFHEGLEYILEIVGKGDNMPIAGLIPIIVFFTYSRSSEAFRHDRLIAQGRVGRDPRRDVQVARVPNEED